MLTTIAIICVLLYMVYKYGTRNFNFWKKKGIRQRNPIPFMGDSFLPFINAKDGLEMMVDFYNSFKGERFGGIYMFQIPFLILRDPELMKQILVKDAEYFVNRHDWFESNDPLMSKNLSVLKDEKWRSLRTVMTTVFTSAKMKDMFEFMRKVGVQSVENIDSLHMKNMKKNSSDVLELDLKNFFAQYGTDAIATTAYGLEVNSFENPDNEFCNAGLAIRQAFRGFNMIKLMVMMGFPLIAKLFNLTFFDKKTNKFFTSIVSDTIKVREEKKIVRKDVIHILMEARKEIIQNGEVKQKLTEFTDADIAAQAMIFFFGGFETMANLLGFMCYELAINQDVQEKLQQEIDEIVEKENGVTYDGVIHQMHYLDMVVNETLRKWPPATLTDREASKDYVIKKTDTSPEVVLNKGDKVLIPIAGLHYDPEYFPNPNKFDPERFRDEKNTIKPFTYLPFGAGLRHCVGMRFALMEVKTGMVELLRKYTIVPTANTQIPIKLSKDNGFMLIPEGGFVLGVKPRQ